MTFRKTKRQAATDDRAAARGLADRSLTLTLVTGLVLLLVLGLVFSVAYGSQRITSDAGALHTADETLRSATVARAQLALAVHISVVDSAMGTNSSEAVALSVGEAEQALADFRTGIENLYSQGVVSDLEMQDLAGAFGSTGDATIELLGSNNPDAAQEVMESAFAPEFEHLTDELVTVRNTVAASVASSDAALGRVGNLARFLVAFLIPAIVIFVYRELLRRQQRQLDLENRLDNEKRLGAARDTFIANASHELRTPLTSIIGLSELLSEDPAIKKTPAAAELIDLIMSESDDLARMVEDLLTTARLDAGALHYVFDDIDIEEEVADTVALVQRAGQRITMSCAPGVVRADRLRLRQLIHNLLSNARKYGGPDVRVAGRVDGRTYVCEIIDDGPGIPEELTGRLFEKFIHQGHMTATKDSVGLGLSIVHALALGMGGSIAYERNGGDTHFIVRLPLSDSEIQPTQVPKLETASARATHRSKEHV
ncbi:MAG: HAMP domain-containing histidine kinase [Acidimicrobiia bacterium]|nr:HAMP domain-containing histidine kinase [Acidimicrobiia bacterium]